MFLQILHAKNLVLKKTVDSDIRVEIAQGGSIKRLSSKRSDAGRESFDCGPDCLMSSMQKAMGEIYSPVNWKRQDFICKEWRNTIYTMLEMEVRVWPLGWKTSVRPSAWLWSQVHDVQWQQNPCPTLDFTNLCLWRGWEAWMIVQWQWSWAICNFT